MPPRTISVLFLLVLAVFAACGHPSDASKHPDNDIASTSMELMPHTKVDSLVHTISLPHDEPAFPPGPGREEFVTACIVCHSPRYITMQPRFSRATWLSEVNKMKDSYGAHISSEQAARITDYLVSINGKAITGQAPKGTYGE